MNVRHLQQFLFFAPLLVLSAIPAHLEESCVNTSRADYLWGDISKPDSQGRSEMYPQSLYRAGGALDPLGNLLVFGGFGNSTTDYQETFWSFSVFHKHWKQLSAGPSRRSRTAMAATKDRLYLFGGETSSKRLILGDFWEFVFSTETWTELSNAGAAPPPLKDACAIPRGENFIVFGGMNQPPRSKQKLTWQYSKKDSSWTIIVLLEDLPKNFGSRMLHTCAYDLKNDALYTFGGGLREDEVRNDFWRLDLKAKEWELLGGDPDQYSVHATAIWPGALRDGSLLYDSARERMILAFGTSDSIWAFSLRLNPYHVWSRLANTTGTPRESNPGQLTAPVVAYNSENDSLLVFGGLSGRGVENLVWNFELCAKSCPTGGTPENQCTEICPHGSGIEHSQKNCTECPPGKMSFYARCIPCPIGTFSVHGNASFCNECSPGYGNQNDRGSSMCKSCQPGEFWRQGACMNCSIGTFSTAPATTFCFTCDSGLTTYAKASTTCVSCSAGEFLWQKRCLRCREGTVSSKKATHCETCLIGKYSFTDRCINCPEGKFSNDVAGSSCSKCLPGKYTSDPGQTYCKQCPTAAWSSLRASHCSACSGSAEISADRYGTKPNAQSSVRDCYCLAGYYGAPYMGQACTKCKSGPGVTCPENSSLPVIASGFYRSISDPSVAISCVPPEACASTENAESTTCGIGYDGNRCGACAPNTHYRLGIYCEECSLLQMFNIFVFLIGVQVGLFFVLKNSTPAYKRIISFTIAGTALQLLDLVSRLMETRWPGSVRWLFNLTMFLNFNFEVLSPECSFPISYWAKWHIKMVTPLLLGAMSLSYLSFEHLLIPGLFYKSLMETVLKRMIKTANTIERSSKILAAPTTCGEKYKGDEDPFRYSRYTFAYGLIQYGIHTLLVSTSLELFQCSEQADGLYYMHRNPQQQCYSTYWFQMLVTNIVFGGYAVIYVPLRIFFIIRYSGDKLNEAKRRNSYRCWLLPYRPECRYWVVFEMCYRSLIIFTTDFIGFYNQRVGLLGVLGLLVLHGAVVWKVSPYKIRLNMLISLAYVCLVFVLMIDGRYSSCAQVCVCWCSTWGSLKSSVC